MADHRTVSKGLYMLFSVLMGDPVMLFNLKKNVVRSSGRPDIYLGVTKGLHMGNLQMASLVDQS